MTVGSSERRAERHPRVAAIFGEEMTPAVLDVLELAELAWHDCYRETDTPAHVINDILICSEGDLAKLCRAARLALVDWRDVAVWAQAIRDGNMKRSRK